MKDEKKNNRKVLPDGQQKKRIKKIDSKQQQEQEQLFSQADSISPISKQINKAEIVELNSGEQVDIDEYILENYVEVSTHFYRSFYFLIADLLRVSRETMKPFVKAPIVPLLKKALIYGRFPNAVQYMLYKKNKYKGYYTRTCWNYQWLTKKADLILRGFIDDFEKEAEKVLADNGDVKVFIRQYCNKFDIPIQSDMFEQI